VSIQDIIIDTQVPFSYTYPIKKRVLINTQIYVAPRNDVEETLSRIWSEVLGVSDVGVHDDFFELGGHSLLATQLLSHVTDTLQVGLPLRWLFDGPTVADIAKHIDDVQWAVKG
jgi:acyl carrier protein